MVDEERLKAFEAKTQRFLEEKSRKPGLRKASEVIEEDQTLRPYSVRLSAKELMGIKDAAQKTGLSTSEFVRRLILEGLERSRVGTETTIEATDIAKVVGEIRDLLGKVGLAPTIGPKIVVVSGEKKHYSRKVGTGQPGGKLRKA